MHTLNHTLKYKELLGMKEIELIEALSAYAAIYSCVLTINNYKGVPGPVVPSFGLTVKRPNCAGRAFCPYNLADGMSHIKTYVDDCAITMKLYLGWSNDIPSVQWTRRGRK